jgi:hypothetical protein
VRGKQGSCSEAAHDGVYSRSVAKPLHCRRGYRIGDEPRPGAPREIGDEKIERVVRLTLEKTPKGATHVKLASVATNTVDKSGLAMLEALIA